MDIWKWAVDMGTDRKGEWGYRMVLLLVSEHQMLPGHPRWLRETFGGLITPAELKLF